MTYHMRGAHVPSAQSFVGSRARDQCHVITISSSTAHHTVAHLNTHSLAMSHFYDPSQATYFDPAVDTRTAIVTGGNSGIGWYTVLHLYLHGYRVYLAGRNQAKVDKAIIEIQAEAKSRFQLYSEEHKAQRPLGNLRSLHFDCCDLKSVVKCAEAFQAQENKLNILINNAGVMAVPHEMTADGYEIQYQVNLVAPFLFTMKLLPTLTNSKADGMPRVINLTSLGHTLCTQYYDPSDTINRKPNIFYSWMRYANAKRASIEITSKLAEKHPELLAFSVHPGVITDTELYNYWTSVPYLGPIAKLFKNLAGSIAGVSCEKGSLASLKAALDQALSLSDSGAYFITGGEKAMPSGVARDQHNIDTTWAANIASLEKKGFL